MANPKSFTQALLKRFVRFHMTLILLATIAAGVQVDHVLREPLHSMPWRYGLAVLAAYGVFFGLVRMWIWYAAGIPPAFPDLSGALDSNSSLAGGRLPGQPGFSGFGGGDSGGAGASSSWGVGDSLPAVSTGGGGGSGGFDVDLDDGAWVLVLLAIFVAVICGAGAYVIYMAPEILPEVALEAALATGLVRAARKMERNNWAGKLLYKTFVPLVIVLITASVIGFFIQAQCPKAGRVAEALRCSELP